VFPISAINGEGTKPLIYAIHEALEKMVRPEVDDEPLESDEKAFPEN
jgi:GTP-binding protein